MHVGVDYPSFGAGVNLPPARHGHLLPLDAEGYLINECGEAALTPYWQPAIQAAIACYQRQLGEGLRSVWLRGSVPRGLGVPGISDLDTLALVAPGVPLEAPWVKGASTALSRAHPEVQGVELWLLSEQALLQDPDQRRRLSMLATQARCVHGDPLTGRLPRVKPGLDTVYACRDLRPLLAEVFAELHAEEDPDERRACVRWIAKCLVRAGLEICIPAEPVFTRDLWPCWEVFGRHHPTQRAEMFAVMAWAIEPERASEVDIQRMEALGAWLVEQAQGVWGDKLVG